MRRNLKTRKDGKSDIREDLALSHRAQGKSALPTGPDCLSTEEIKKNGTCLFGTLLVLHRTNARSSGTAEERDERMALKIR
ncbi:MAG: hypothetical protein MUP98_00940 [Candidatus Aminicenantes bacterium]|nr:hypothetical protein [Candidatus Aminicenantes bacterium]